jgi:hypothetical protein
MLSEYRYRIEPLLYRTLCLCQSSWNLPLLLRTIDARPRLLSHTTALHIPPSIIPNDPCIVRVLAQCPRTERLVDRSYGRTPFALLCALPLRRLCISLSTIDDLDFTLDLGDAFARLTHLHLLDAPPRWAHVPFARLPALTHLALQNYKAEIRSASVPVLRGILDACPMLRVLVVFIPLCRPADGNALATKTLVDDSRLVILSATLDSRCDLWMRETSVPEQTHSYGTCEQQSDWAKKVRMLRPCAYSSIHYGRSPRRDGAIKGRVKMGFRLKIRL